MNEQRTTTTITLTGQAGCGKTVLMHTIAGLLAELGLEVELHEGDGCHQGPVPVDLAYANHVFGTEEVEPRKVVLKTKETF